MRRRSGGCSAMPIEWTEPALADVAGNDRAMQVSRFWNGGVYRAGDVPPDGPVIVEKIDTVDATATSTEVLALNHSGYAESKWLINDIMLLFRKGERPPGQRTPILKRINVKAGTYWLYP